MSTTNETFGELVAGVILANLYDRSGFDHWWDQIDEGTQTEIAATLAAEVESVIHPSETTLTVQSRLLDLAETLAGAVDSIESSLSDTQKPAGLLKVAIDCTKAFTAAKAEYQTTGAVPCGECEVKDSEIRAHGTSIDELIRENDDLRRQLAETESKHLQEYKARMATDSLLLDVKADNAALIEAGRTFWSAVLGWRDSLSIQLQYNDSLDQDAKDSIDFILKRIAVEAGAFEQALSQPHPGAAMLEELAALRKALRHARQMAKTVGDNTSNEACLNALDQFYIGSAEAWDAIRNREGR